jgi:hypothetical protein
MVRYGFESTSKIQTKRLLFYFEIATTTKTKKSQKRASYLKRKIDKNI